MIEEITRRHWDAIVVGTGMGGATLGYALAKAGKNVLFCEKGKSAHSSASLAGCYAEELLENSNKSNSNKSEVFKNAGREWLEIEDRTKTRVRTHIPFIGAGTGGSSALYGMALERFFPEDFTPRASYPDAGDSALPYTWPITYRDLLPFYEEAERLYRVRGSPDVLRGANFYPPYLDPPPLSAGAQILSDYLYKQGCHPYRLPMACEFLPNCNCCQGYLCSRECKNDSGRICLEPALTKYGAQLLNECEVVSLQATGHEVTGVVSSHYGQTVILRGDIVILAAGALFTPKILLQSCSEKWPKGLANRSGQVGKNLMRHYIDLYVLSTKAGLVGNGAWKELAFNDYYFLNGRKLGSVQGFGALPPVKQLVESLTQELRQSPFPSAEFFFRPLKPFLRRYLESRVVGKQVLATVVEDLPYEDNRIELGTGGRIQLNYHIRAYEQERVDLMRARMRGLLKPFRPMLIKQAENNERLAHACGTCRMGVSSADSVLDGNNRAHEVDNLYVVDASFFPSSAGINPSLTVAANALRVAEHIKSKKQV